MLSQELPFTPIPTLVEAIEKCLELNIKMFIEVKAYQDSVKVKYLVGFAYHKVVELMKSFVPRLLHFSKFFSRNMIFTKKLLFYHFTHMFFMR